MLDSNGEQMVSDTSGLTQRCPYCAEEVLAEAVKCKHCGEFLKKDKNFESRHVTTIQLTAKRWKLWRMVGALILCAGAMAFAFVWRPLGVALMLAGIMTIAAARIAAHWFHG